MNIIEFLFKLLAQFVPMDERKEIRLKGEAQEWYLSRLEEDKNDALSKAIKEHCEKWYFQTGMAVLYIFAIRWIAEFMSGSDRMNEDED